MLILEGQGIRYTDCSVSFVYNKTLIFKSNNTKTLFKDVIDWLYKNGYKFSGDLHKKSSTTRALFTEDEVDKIISKTSYEKRMFHNIAGTDKFISFNNKVTQLFSDLKKMLINFGIDESTIIISGIDIPSKIKKFAEIEPEPEDSTEDSTEETIDVLVNPFQQSICVLGESGSGKSVTIENILENEGHEFEFIIPSATTTNLLAQFSPSKSGYVPSRLGKMIIAAAQNPDKLYTAVFDEMHKSSVISMINDELLQCISTKRNNGVRFISLDDDTSELYNIDDLEKSRGNIILPENFGFIFISSKPKVISNNPDFFNRVDIVILKHHDEETIDSSDELLDKVLDDVEKAKLASNRND